MENPATSYTAVERLICKLRDVRSCGIRVDADGSIAAVHVTARAGRPAKQIARDVEAILSAEEGIAVDHRKISVAQYEGGSSPLETVPRLAIGGVSLHQSAGQYEADVLLVAGDLQATGHSTGSNTQSEIRRTVASATLDAIRRLVKGEPRLTLGEVEEKELGDRRLVIVRVDYLRDRDEKSLFGCSEISYDSTQSVILATLDAVNRLLGSLEPRDPVEYEVGPTPLPEAYRTQGASGADS
jgi:hypothetical protein